MRILVLLILSISLLTACSGNKVSKEVVEPVPTGSIENFEMDTKLFIQTIGSAANNMKPYTEEQKSIITQYLKSYKDNPRLNKDQTDLVNKLSNLDAIYGIYVMYKDDKDNVKMSNDSIQLVFNDLHMLEEDGYTIK